MEIKITCRACERDFPLSMAVQAEARPGHCPFCGETLAFQYVGTFLETADRVMALAPEFARQLTLLSELAGTFELDAASILDPIAAAIAAQDQQIASPYQPNWPPRPAEVV